MSVSITDLDTATTSTVNPTGWYLEGGASGGGLSRPTAIRLFTGGFLVGGNVTAWDNLSVVPTNTPAGSGVVVDLNGGSGTSGGATVTFSSVTTSGDTTLTPSSSCAPAPDRFKVVRPPPPGPPEQTCFDISTTAVYTGPVEVCFNYTGWAVSNDTSLQLRHWDGSGWENPLPGTFSLDTFNKIICGSFTSLSPFALFEPDNEAPVITCNAPVTLWSPDHDLIDAASSFSVSDPDGDDVTLTVRAFSDETEIPETGDGTGRHAPDFKNELYEGGRGLMVRSERRSSENGRVYIVLVTADDGRGGVTNQVCIAAVCPHDQNQTSLDAVLAEAAVARGTIESALANAEALPPAGLSEHGLSPPLGPRQ